MAGLRKGLTGGGGGGVNMQTVVLGVISIVIGLIMLGISMDQIYAVVSDNTTYNWTLYPGAQSVLELFPLLMMISLVFLGGIMVWLGTGGQSVGASAVIMITIIVVVAVILLPIVMSQTNTLMTRSDISTFTGLKSFLGLVPLLYTVGVMGITGILGFRKLGGSVKARRAKAGAY